MKWTRYDPRDPNNSIIVPEHINNPRPSLNTEHRYGMWALRVSAAAQVGMLIIIAIGYIWTVLPVFQKQLLEEQVAQLQIERREAEARLARLKEERVNMKDELNTLRRTVALERSRRAELANAIEDVERREALARSRLTQLKEQVSDELAALESARWELLLSDLQNAWIIRSTSQELLQDWDSRQSLEEYLLERRENWPNPYETILDSIERIQKRNRADDRLPTGYFRETRKFVERNRNYLVCEKPDIDSLLETLRHEQQKIDHIAERKTEKSIQEIVARYEDRGQEVKITDEFRERQKRIHRVGEKHRIERRFRDVIDGYLYQCRAAIRNIMRQLTREKDVRL